MMKNTEWGSVAYLQHSEYGSHQNVRFNNNSNSITGYASVVKPTCGYTGDSRDCNQYGTTEDITLPYDTETGYLASTTGNITGVYDMAGGAWEYVMGVMLDENGKPMSGRNTIYHSQFIGAYGEGDSLTLGYSWPLEKYYDKYLYSMNYSEFTRGKLGDATSELGPYINATYGEYIRPIGSWYANSSKFIYSVLPWFDRGGGYYNGSESGVFAFDPDRGSDNLNITFRITLTP